MTDKGSGCGTLNIPYAMWPGITTLVSGEDKGILGRSKTSFTRAWGIQMHRSPDSSLHLSLNCILVAKPLMTPVATGALARRGS